MHNPGLIKRLLVIIYDCFLLIAVAMVSSALLMALLMFLLRAIAPDSFFIDPATLENPKIIQLSQLGRNIGSGVVVSNCIIISVMFYTWFWTHGGQTLGMKAWNLYLVNPEGKFVSKKTALIRFLCAIISWVALGLGFIWILFSKRNHAWHDIWSNSQIVYVPKDQQPTREKL